jgi:hypothetical protein
MKPSIIFIVLTIVLTYFSCEKNNVISDFPFQAEVLGRNTDCGIFAIKFTDDLDKVVEIVGTSVSEGCYIAKNLPDELQISGLIIVLNLREPAPSELTPCTAMGPSLNWIYVTKAKLK